MPAVATKAPSPWNIMPGSSVLPVAPRITACRISSIVVRVVGTCWRCCHDLERLRQHPAAYWKHLFDTRFFRNQWPYGSSVWGKKEMVCPEVENANIVSTFEGGTNLFWAERLGKEIRCPRALDQAVWQ